MLQVQLRHHPLGLQQVMLQAASRIAAATCINLSKALQITQNMRGMPLALSSDSHVVLLMRALHLQSLASIPLLSPIAPHLPHITLAFEFSRRSLHVFIAINL